jgi:hypothetical protein
LLAREIKLTVLLTVLLKELLVADKRRAVLPASSRNDH